MPQYRYITYLQLLDIAGVYFVVKNIPYFVKKPQFFHLFVNEFRWNVLSRRGIDDRHSKLLHKTFYVVHIDKRDKKVLICIVVGVDIFIDVCSGDCVFQMI